LNRDGRPAVVENEIDANGNRTGTVRIVESASGWHERLNWLNRWIMPQGKIRIGKKLRKDDSIRQVGGLSLNRLATFKSLYQIQKAFFTRLKPDGKKPDPAGEGFGQRMLDALERMRENRVKQLASRIVEAALGVGIEQSRTEKGKQRQRPRKQIPDARFAPCHAVVIENLTHYRPDELQTRRENRQLMTWASGQVKKHLTDQCQLHGLHLREVQPAYTSRQDFRTGAPGMRCVDVTVSEFCKRFRRDLRRATVAPKPNALEQYLLDLAAMHCETKNDRLVPKDGHSDCLLRIPRKGGEIFVSALELATKTRKNGAPGIHADLNAAGNIGLKALTDPDWAGAWWNVPAVLDKDGYRVPHPERTAGAQPLESWKLGRTSHGYAQNGSPEVLDSEAGTSKSPKRKRPKDVINLWRDVSDRPLEQGEWRVYAAYEANVRWRVIQILRRSMGLQSVSVPSEDGI
jgi:IS605 OrfB family transposase